MNLEVAVTGLLKVRNDLRSRQGVTDPAYISEQMQRLAQYAGAVEEHLGILEEEQENMKLVAFHKYLAEGRSVNMAETLCRKELGSHEGEIAKLSRLVKSSWALISTAQSRINHLQSEYKLGGRVT